MAKKSDLGHGLPSGQAGHRNLLPLTSAFVRKKKTFLQLRYLKRPLSPFLLFLFGGGEGGLGCTIIEIVVFCTFRGLQYFSELIDSRLLQRLFKVTCLENLGGIFCIYLLHSTPIS